MRTIRILVEYDGAAYCGWQVQPNGPTVQAALEEALLRLTGETIRIRGAGRTDSGVHALGQVAAFETESAIPAERFAHALNSRLPLDISVRRSNEAPPGFDPRRAARRKRYRYLIDNGPVRPALHRGLRWYVPRPLDRAAMAAAARRYLGTHDFTSFSHKECEAAGDNVRTLLRSELTTEGDLLRYEVEARGFLYNMVRNLVGTLVDVGAGRFAPEEIDAIFAARDRAAAGQGAPPHGLCLVRVWYGEGMQGVAEEDGPAPADGASRRSGEDGEGDGCRS
jgi:tRNA pseudouridine38-40 synthase